jgi:hypothetical protein
VLLRLFFESINGGGGLIGGIAGVAGIVGLTVGLGPGDADGIVEIGEVVALIVGMEDDGDIVKLADDGVQLDRISVIDDDTHKNTNNVAG